MDNKKLQQEAYERMMGKWYSWDAPVGLGAGLVSLAASLWIVAEAVKIFHNL